MSQASKTAATRLAFGLSPEPRSGLSPFVAWRGTPSFPGAVCAQVDPELWFSPELGGPHTLRQEAKAVELCQGCPHITGCADYAVSNRIEFGVWGGLTEADRRTIWEQDGEAA